jgi:hypothetical protein
MYKKMYVTIPYKRGTRIPIKKEITHLDYQELLASVIELRWAKARPSGYQASPD